MFEDAGCKFKLNFDGEGVKNSYKSPNYKVHFGIQYSEQILQEERIYTISSEKL